MDIKSFFKREKFIVLDGAFATELERDGLDIKDPLWSALALIDHKDMVEKVHKSYLEAGSDIITSSSYQATVKGFMKKGIAREQACRLITESVEIAVKARDSFVASQGFDDTKRLKPLVAASVGPYGAYLADGSEYRGDYSVSDEDLYQFHKERLELLSYGKPDLIACETIPKLNEALAILRACKSLELKLPLWISFSCKDGLHISDSTPISECARALEKYDNVIAVGINCTAPDLMSSLIREVRSNTSKQVVIYPNSGELYDPVSKTWSGGAVRFIMKVDLWYKDGATMIGGCCRSTPEDIAYIAALSRSLR